MILLRTIGLAAIVLALAPIAQATPPRTVHLYGDSIMKGWGFGHYDDPSPLGRIDRIATMLARANGSSLRFNRTTVQAPYEICRAVARGAIKATDTIVFEDAGPRFELAASEQSWLEHVVSCATKRRGKVIARPSRLVFSTMFDFQPAYPLSTYDTPLDDGRSVNDVTRQVARANRTGLLDWNGRMDAAALALPELQLVHPDGIHPTPFGNILIAASILKREGVRIVNVAPLLDELEARQAAGDLRWWAPAFTREQAAQWVEVLT